MVFAIKISSDSTIFLANGQGGLRAYNYDGSSFTNTAHIQPGDYVRDLDVSSDGTIFVANGYDGLKAYTYDGSFFTNTAHIDDGG